MREQALMWMKKLRICIFSVLGGFCFSALDRCGYMLKNYGSIWMISENPWHRTIFHRILCELPRNVCVVFVLFLLLNWIRRIPRPTIPGEKWETLTEKKSWFFVLWGIYFLSFLPAFLGGYPGIFAADAPNQIGWTFSGWLTAHHPLVHTGFLCGIFAMSRSLGWSDVTAAAICNGIQMLALSGIFARYSRFLKQEKAPLWLQLGTILFLCIVPFHAMMAVYTTKDTLFAGLFLLCSMQIYQMCVRPEEYFSNFGRMMGGYACFVAILLFRNNGFHTILLSAPFLLIYLRRYWKKLLPLILAVFLTYVLYQGPVMKLVGAEPANSREAYSVVMQTLGRTYVAAGDIRPEEMDVIRPVMDEETLSLYVPFLSDNIKNYFNTEAFEQNRGEFLAAWLRVGLRNTKIYIDAFLHTTEGFWYPGTNREYLPFACIDIALDNENYPHVQMKPLIESFYNYYDAIGTRMEFQEIPVVKDFLSMGFYFWLMLFCVLYVIYRKEYEKLIWILPFAAYMATNMLGPTAMLRYSYPLMAGAPLFLFFVWQRCASEE